MFVIFVHSSSLFCLLSGVASFDDGIMSSIQDDVVFDMSVLISMMLFGGDGVVVCSMVSL